MREVHCLSTTDNPFDPVKQFDDWYRYDMDKGYGTCAYLARIAKSSDELTDDENIDQIESAIREIVSFDLINLLYPDVHYIRTTTKI